MKKEIYLLLALLLSASVLSAQEAFRTEFFPYTLRADAVAFKPSEHTPLIPLENFARRSDTEHFDVTENIPIGWMVGRVFVHLENVRKPYTLLVNGREVLHQNDPLTPRDYEVTDFLQDGENTFSLRLADSAENSLAEGVSGWYMSNAKQFTNSYVYLERKRRIKDYRVRINPNKEQGGVTAVVDVIAENSNPYDEPFEVGYDLYAPDGKLLGYGRKNVEGAAQSVDTLQFKLDFSDNYRHRWSHKNPALYRLTVYVRTSGVIRSYITQRVGYTDYEFRNGELYNFGKKVDLQPVSFGAKEDKTKTREHLRQLKLSGLNTLTFLYPQPLWLYEMADEMGYYVVEQASINTPTAGQDRQIGGTPSNNPALLEDYLARVKASYSRVQNRASVIAFSVGGASGVGFNIYRSYLWLKDQERLRPIFYRWAEGEWCTDEFKL